MSTSKGTAQWKGTIKEGKGTLKFSGFEGEYSFASRFENANKNTPEQLVASAHASCFSMYLSLLLTQENLDPESIETHAEVMLGKDDTGPKISRIDLNTRVRCQGLQEDKLKELVAVTKEKCPVSRLYSGGTAQIEAHAELLN